MPEKRVLVVDDNPVVLESIGLLVVHIGHAVETAASGADALRKLDRSRFDLVLSDLKMPEMNGAQLAQEIKKRQPTLPIVLISGSPSLARSPDAVGFLRKPFSLDDLREAIATFM